MLCSRSSFLCRQPVLCMPLVLADVYLLELLLVYLLWLCMLACLLKCWWCSCLCSFLQSPSLCSLCDCFRAASLQCTCLGQACIRCAPHTGVFFALYAATSETSWSHLYWVSPLMAYSWWWCILHSWNSSSGFFLPHVKPKGLTFYVAIALLSTR